MISLSRRTVLLAKLYRTYQYPTVRCFSLRHNSNCAIHRSRLNPLQGTAKNVSGELTLCNSPLTSQRHISTQPNVGQRFTSLDDVRQHITHVPVELHGVNFDLGVVVLGDPSHPAVLCSHGVPGGAEDFLNLVPTLLELGLRVILPSFPGFNPSSVVERDLFRLTHSTAEKADILRLVCSHFNIDRVAMVISHSQGSAAAYKFCAEEDVQSAVFLSPCGYIPQQTAQPYRLLQLFVAFLRNPLFRPFFSKLLAFQYKRIGFTVTELSQLQAAVLTVSSVDFAKNLDYAKVIAGKKLPVVFVMSQNDRIIEWKRPFDLLQHMEVPEDSIVYYDKESVPSHRFSSGSDQDWYTRVLIFTKGGHLIHRTQQDLVIGQIEQLVRFVTR